MNAEMVIRSIIGPARRDIRPLAYVAEVAEELLFERRMAMDDILVTKDIYPDVAKRMGKKRETISRRVERMTSYCWDVGDRDRLEQVAGKRLRFCPTPRELVIYLAFYAYLDMPFYEAIEREPTLLF